MTQKLGFITAIMLCTSLSVAQNNYDTLLVMKNYTSLRYSEDNIDWHPIKKQIKYYDAKGRLYQMQGFAFSEYKPYNSYFNYQETYKYGSNDSLVLFQIDVVPNGQTKFWAREIWDYSYKGSLLTEVRITKYAHTYGEKLENQKMGRWRRDWGGADSDTSGWTTIAAIRFSYDNFNRLVQKAEYGDYADKVPETMWMYTYDSELPDINSYTQIPLAKRTIYNHLYKNDKLVIYREEVITLGIDVDLDTRTYFYNKNGDPTGLEISNSKMKAKKRGDPFKKDGKEEVTHREEYKYTDGRIISKEVSYKYSYTKYKVSFLDAMSRMPSTSTSTTRYGDYQTTTTTTTSRNQAPPRTEDMIAKTKQKWFTYTTKYEYDANGKLVTGLSSKDSRYTYDSRGRVKQFEDWQFDEYGSTRTRYIYGYRN